MNQVIRPMNEPSTTSAWRLWIDRCGGYGLLTGDRITIGGSRPDGTVDVQVRADWRRREGTLVRRDGDYFWAGADTEGSNEAGAELLLRSGAVFPISGSATLRLSKPSPLSGTARLDLDPPHRFEHHVDQMLLVDQTIVIGPHAGAHIRCTAIETSAVVVLREGIWRAKLKPNPNQGHQAGAASGSRFTDLLPGRKVSLGELDMMLEQA